MSDHAVQPEILNASGETGDRCSECNMHFTQLLDGTLVHVSTIGDASRIIADRKAEREFVPTFLRFLAEEQAYCEDPTNSGIGEPVIKVQICGFMSGRQSRYLTLTEEDVLELAEQIKSKNRLQDYDGIWNDEVAWILGNEKMVAFLKGHHTINAVKMFRQDYVNDQIETYHLKTCVDIVDDALRLLKLPTIRQH